MTTFIPLSYLIKDWPTDIVSMPPTLDHIGLSEYVLTQTSDAQYTATGTLVVDEAIIFEIPFIPGLSLALLYAEGLTEFDFSFALVLDRFYLDISNFSASLLYESELLKAVEQSGTDAEGNPVLRNRSILLPANRSL